MSSYTLLKTLTFQSMVEKNECLLISSTPSGPAPEITIKILNLIRDTDYLKHKNTNTTTTKFKKLIFKPYPHPSGCQDCA